ncbi:MAG: hypothetical protein GC182_02550 [Rhodopseudomonas sp.]|nr:hypothetical protein [Rhodopseudomonas sp.]
MPPDTSGRPYLLIQRLTPRLAAIARLVARTGIAVMYLQADETMRQGDGLARLAASGVRQIDYAQLRGFDAYGHVKLVSRLATRLTDRLLPETAAALAAEAFPPVDDRTRKVRALFHDFLSGHLWPASSLYTAADHLRATGHRCFVWPPETPSAPLFLRDVMSWPEWALSCLLTAGAVLRNAVSRLAGRLPRRATTSGPAAASPTDATAPASAAPVATTVLMFPHQGPFYGPLFEKNQYYVDDAVSPLNRGNVLHIEIADFLSAPTRETVDQSYRKAGIVPLYLAIPPLGGGPGRWIAALKRGRAAGLSLSAALIVEILRARIERARASLRPFGNARMALLGYEYLFPVWFAYALQANGLRIVASQERLLQAFLPDRAIIIDDYFVHSEAAREALQANRYACIGAMHVVGDVRTEDLARPVARHDGFPPGYDHATLVLDWHSDADPAQNAQNTTNNWANNISFYRDILRLARRFPRCCFVLRGKNAVWVDLPALADVRAEVGSLPNVTVSTDYSRPYIAYDLAAAADSIVARYTSLGDQCLAAGKPVIYHEGTVTECLLASSIVDFSPYPIMAHSAAELEALYTRVVETGDTMPPEARADMIGRFFAPPQPTAPAKTAMRAKLLEFLAEPAKAG